LYGIASSFLPLVGGTTVAVSGSGAPTLAKPLGIFWM